MKRVGYFLFAIILIWASCMPYEQSSTTNIQLDMSDPELQRLINYQDARQTDSLAVFLQSRNATYRYVAAMALASSRDKAGLEGLYPLLSDRIDHVRGAAAYAIGQIGDSLSVNALLRAFDRSDSLRQYNFANSQILEAVGKCGKRSQLDALASIKTYTAEDTLLLLGQTRGIYRFALRGFVSVTGTKLMVDYVKNDDFPERVRLMAAHYLHRSKGITVDSTATPLFAYVKKEKNPDVRMALVTGIAKTKMDMARDTLISLLKTEKDYRVKCNIIRAFSFFEYRSIAAAVYEALLDPNPHVAYAAADFFYHNGHPDDGKIYRAKAREVKNWRVRTRLYGAANNNLTYFFTTSKTAITQELLPLFQQSKNIYEKAAILEVLSDFGWTYPQIKSLGVDAENPVLKTAGVQGLIHILEDEEFKLVFQASSLRVAGEIKGYLVEALRSDDVGSVALAAGAMRNPDLNFKAYFAEQGGFTFMDTVLQNIKLPDAIETYREVEKTIAFLKGDENAEPTTPEYNHPIEWEMVEVLSSRVRGIIQTNKGKIVLEFFHDAAPASVANFVRLTKDGYYDGKTIHRVVPNFVAQGGCDRGDGYGSVPHSIRTEVSDNLYYDGEGYLGMASAGRDTESSQWFITHSPTPHLDGNYTIFGRVKDGMDVVHQLEVGDVIEKAVVRF